MLLDLNTIEALIDWAVAPAAPLPPVAQTSAAAAFAHSLELGPRGQRLALAALLAALRAPGADPLRLLARLHAGPLAPLTEALAAMAQLAYYGEPAVLAALECPAAAGAR